MTTLTPSKPVLAVGLNRRGGEAGVERVLATGVPVVLLAERGFPVPDDVLAHVEVPVNRARVGRAVREARRHGASWIAVPRTMGTAEYLMASLVRSAGRYLDADHPGLAMLVASPRPRPTTPRRPRALVVVDPAGPASSGWAVLAAVQLAVHSGAALDIAVLGVSPDAGATENRGWLGQLPVARQQHLVLEALALAEAYELAPTWIAAGTGSPQHTIVELMADGRYDAVVDDLGGHHLRKRLGKRADLHRLLHDPSHGGLLCHLLAETQADVVVAVDGITLGVVPAVAIRTGAAATLALGTVGVGVAAPAHAGEPLTLTTVATTQAEAVAETTARLQAASAALEKAQAALDEATQTAQPAAEALAEARLEFGRASAEHQQALEQHEQAQQRATVVMSVLTAGAVEQQAQQAADALDVAAEAATVAESHAARAYREYLEFADEIAAADRTVAAADAEARRLSAALTEAAEKAERARAKAAGLDEAVAQVEAAWHAQGLHQPADGRVTSHFGPRVHPVTGVYKMHTGTDFAGSDGTYYAAEDGVVTFAGYDGAYGYTVHVDHGRVGGRHVETWYAHQPGLSVQVGETVSRGQAIGRIGNTGYSTGPHAHVELRIDGKPVDIMGYLH